METAGDLAARTYCSCHVAMMKMMILRTYKCNSLDCFDSNINYYVFNILQPPRGDDEDGDIADL